MKILTTNSAGNDKFGGIHTRYTEQVRNSPQHIFHIVELNREKSYISRDNCNVYKVNTEELTNGRSIFTILEEAQTLEEFNTNTERLVNEYQNTIRDINPDVVLIPGTSLASYFLFKAARRENVLNKVVQEYAGVLEKEIENYTGDTRFILGQIGKVFVSDAARNKVSYIFPSEICKKTVEEIHDISLPKSHVIWNGISEEFAAGEPNRMPPEELTLGYIGRIHHVKNLPFFLDLNSNIQDQAVLKIITDISASAGKPQRKLLLERMTEEKVFYYAPRNRQRLRSFYESEISAAVVPSFFETYCLGAIETSVCGTPTLLSDRAGASEVFREFGLEELLFSIDNIKSFERALNHARGMNFRVPPETSRDIYNRLNWKRVIGEYNQVLEEVREQSE